MPRVGDVILGSYRPHRNAKIYLACPECGKERWLDRAKAKRKNFQCICITCRNSKYSSTHKFDKSPAWKGGRVKHPLGYIEIRLAKDDFFYSMTHNSYVKEHRLVKAKQLGRCLHTWEMVHHKNGIRDDNRIENLQLLVDDKHKQLSFSEAKIKRLEAKIIQLKSLNSK